MRKINPQKKRNHAKDSRPEETVTGMSKHPSSHTPKFSADPSALPDDPVILKSIVSQLMDAYRKEQSLVAYLQHQLELQLRHRFGRRSETIDWENSLFPREVIEAMLESVKKTGNIPAVKEVVHYVWPAKLSA